ncbi:unnamed protein product [Ambrosiozyma monospora]|uniref:Unnamed protein product n=1 Tax=Ambrosiozyma monospora TaxID=43982 RepID=A0ACB5U7F3_AMBMO|nr:unnamed protein product [Ambrosiozyma monospora]
MSLSRAESVKYNEEFLEFKKDFFTQRSNSIHVQKHNNNNSNSESFSSKSSSNRTTSRRCSDCSYSSTWIHDPLSEATSVDHFEQPNKLDLTQSNNSFNALNIYAPPQPSNPLMKLARKIKKNSSSVNLGRSQSQSILTDFSKSKQTSISSTISNKSPVSETTSVFHLNQPPKFRSSSVTCSPTQSMPSILPSPSSLPSPITTSRKNSGSISLSAVDQPIIDISDDYFMRCHSSCTDTDSLYSLDDYDPSIGPLDTNGKDINHQHHSSGWYLKDGLLLEGHQPYEKDSPQRNEEEVVADLVAIDVLERLKLA